jgi:hypothetical protein
MPFEIMPVVREIYRLCQSRGVYPPAVTRLVKLIYLADIEWRRRHSGEPLADLSWKFLHYGPYAIELAEPLGDPDMEVTDIAGRGQARRFNFDEESLAQREVPEELSRIIAPLIERWGAADLNELLDYVYFDTAPMESAKRGDLLDFSGLPPVQPTIRPRFDESKIQRIRERIRARVRSLGLSRDGIRIPAVNVAEGLAAWDEDDHAPALRADSPVRFRP